MKCPFKIITFQATFVHFRGGIRKKNKNDTWNWIWNRFNSWPLYPLVGGHLTFEILKGSRITIPRSSQRMTSKTVTPRLFVSFRQLRCFSPNASSIPQNRIFPISDREISASKTLTLVVAESLLVSKYRPLWKAFFNSDQWSGSKKQLLGIFSNREFDHIEKSTFRWK